MTTPIIGTNYAPPPALDFPLAFNDLNPVDALSDSTGLVGAYLFGGNRDATCRNYANPDLPLTLIGNPTVNVGGGTNLDYLNGFDTQLPETAAFSMLALVKAPTAGKGVIISNGSGNGPGGIGSVLQPGGAYLQIESNSGFAAVTAAAAKDQVGAGVIPTRSGPSPLFFYPTTNYIQAYAKGDATDVSASAHCSSQAQVNTTPVATGSRGLNKRSIWIGANYMTASGGVASLDLLAVYLFNVKQSDGVRNANFASVATWFNTTSGLGITTL